jgi:hypothetical protein
MSEERFQWWNNLLHGGLLLDAQRLRNLIPEDPQPLDGFQEDRLRRQITSFQDDPEEKRGHFVAFVLESVCGLKRPLGEWSRGSEVSTAWSRRAITGEAIRPRHVWISPRGAVVPVFIDDEKRLGIGRGKRIISHVLQWLRQSDEQLAIVTNGHQWRLLFAGLDYDAFCEWDIVQWFTEGQESEECRGLRALLASGLWTPTGKGEPCPLLSAINESRKGQSDLSQVLGERVRQAVELLVRAHAPVLNALPSPSGRGAGSEGHGIAPQDIYRAGVRMIMRMVVVLFAESREGLLPRDNPIYHGAYSLGGLRDQLERTSRHRRRNGLAAYPRILSLFRLIHEGCSHEALLVPQYGGELFAPGDPASEDGANRAMAILENGCFEQDVVNDDEVRDILDLLTRTKIKIRQGRMNMMMPAPVDFSRLDSEYIGILYEGLLDFELRTAPIDNPIVFLAVGNQPALPLATLDALDDRAIKNLLEKLKDTSSDSEEDEEAEDEAEVTDEDISEPEGDESGDDEEDVETVDEPEAAEDGAGQDYRHTTRARAEAWARRACELGNLVTRPRGRMTPERRMQYEAALDRKARQIVTRVVLPGEWYLVRWGGTRKGSGTFYTRPQLAVPTVHRTLRPLAYDPPMDKDGKPDVDAPLEKWTPKRPEEILKLKVCDPACGSGSFLLASLRFLAEALLRSLRHHGRIRDHAGRAVLDLIKAEDNGHFLASEALPCRPDDDDFEPRTKAVLRRYIVERCIYGVDLDPLAVELCRLSLWIETLDRRLPMTFLEHKIKCGNSLVGAWFDQFMHYPVMAWEREGGDKNHTNGVHYQKEQWTKAIKERKKQVKTDLIKFIDGAKLIYKVDLSSVQTVHDEAERALQAIHTLGIHQTEERAGLYREMRESEAFRRMKDAFDLWCALWFWPADKLDETPLPTEMAEGATSPAAWDIVRDLERKHRFFHWELDFPDVFNAAAHGFDAVLGNPPWETLQPNSKEIFSAIDPLYRSYGKGEAIQRQTELFRIDENIERSWLAYTAFFKAMSTWAKYAGFPFGDRVTEDSKGGTEHDFPIGDRGRTNWETSQRRHNRWKQKREESSGYADATHSFREQGEGKPYTYKLFLEQAFALLRDCGRFGLVVPSGVYSDKGSVGIRRLFLDHCQWEWLFGFENRDRIFDIDNRFRFNPIIIEKGGQTHEIRAAFMRRKLADWEHGEMLVTTYPKLLVERLSPATLIFVELNSPTHRQVLEAIAETSTPLAYALSRAPLSITDTAQGDINLSDKKSLQLVWHSTAIPDSLKVDQYGRLVDATGETVAFPIYQGAMIHHFLPFYARYKSGFGHKTNWCNTDWEAGGAQFWWPREILGLKSMRSLRLVSRRLTNSTNARTMIATVLPDLPSSDTTLVWSTTVDDDAGKLMVLAAVNSLVFDWIARARISGSSGATALDMGRLQELLFPKQIMDRAVPQLVWLTSQLSLAHWVFSPIWLRFRARRLFADKHLQFARTAHERVRLRCMLDAIVARQYGVNVDSLAWILRECDLPAGAVRGHDQKGFWRVDKDKHPEHRQTLLSLVAFHNLQEKISSCGESIEKGIEAFCTQNDGEGWMLPDTLRLADYGLGHDDRAKEHQPVRKCFGPRFYDWQLAQTPEESWRECHLHARNLLGPKGYQALLDELEGRTPLAPTTAKENDGTARGKLFETEHLPLFDQKK